MRNFFEIKIFEKKACMRKGLGALCFDCVRKCRGISVKADVFEMFSAKLVNQVQTACLASC